MIPGGTLLSYSFNPSTYSFVRSLTLFFSLCGGGAQNVSVGGSELHDRYGELWWTCVVLRTLVLKQ